MTAATAIFKGKLADVDVRWNTISAAVDCRNSEERDVILTVFSSLIIKGESSFVYSQVKIRVNKPLYLHKASMQRRIQRYLLST